MTFAAIFSILIFYLLLVVPFSALSVRVVTIGPLIFIFLFLLHIDDLGQLLVQNLLLIHAF